MRPDSSTDKAINAVRAEVAANALATALEDSRQQQAGAVRAPAVALREPAAESRAEPPPVVVGVDQVSALTGPLAWAVAEARHRGTRVVLVHVFEPHGALPPRWRDELDVVQELGLAAGTAVSTSVEVQVMLLQGLAGEVLVDCARDAGLLVLGHRHRSGPLHRPLSGVAAHCLERAQCPVVLVPHDWVPS